METMTPGEKPSSAERISVSFEPLAVFRHDRSLFIPNGLPEYVSAAQVAEAVKIVEDVREQCALMAEGEGDDPQDYMDIAMYAMRQLDEALAMFKEGTK